MARKSPPPTPEAAPPSGEYTVLARRYRPQGFDQLVGQEHVARALENAIKSNRVAHAYLFTGARGVGKTSTARILAKCLNCVKGPTVSPCGECDICKGIATGDDVDVLEIDGASNRGIDNIRELRANIQFRPARARFKIYIIDEVHMVTKDAFNALLKTLEEPPPHVKFIFATTEAGKIPITILSRCQRFDFSGIGMPQIVERLREIVQREGMQAEDEALEMVARRAAGSMRDAQSLLDQLLAFGGDRLTADQVHGLLGTAGDDRVVALASAVLEHDPKKAVELLADLAARTLQPGELLDQLMAYWRDLMVMKVAGDEARDLSVPPRHRDTLRGQATALTLDTILAGLDVLSSAKPRLKLTTQGQLVVEMALVRLSGLENLASIAQLTQMLSQAPAERPAVSPAAPRSVSPPEGIKKKLSEAPSPADAPSRLTLTSQTVSQVWALVLQSLPTILRINLEKAAIPAILGPNNLAVRFDSTYNSQRDYCSESSTLHRLENELLRVTGSDWKLRVETNPVALTEQKVAPTPTPMEMENGLTKARRLKEEVEGLPLIKRAMEVMGAQVVRVEDGFNSAPPAAPLPPVMVPREEPSENEEG